MPWPDELLPEHVDAPSVQDGRPSLGLAVLTCMDTRIDPNLVLGRRLGEAHQLRNAGARVTGDVIRSLTLSAHVFGVRSVVLVEHTKCGLAGVTDSELTAATGAELEFLPIDDHWRALEYDVGRLVAAPSLGPVERIAGLLLDLDTGAFQVAATWERVR